jgi:predicted PurR-regulated permease PerM
MNASNTKLSKALVVKLSMIVALSVVSVVLLLWLCYSIRILLIDLVLAITFASAMTPFVNWAHGKKIPRMLTVFFTYLVIVSLYLVMAMFLAQPIKEQGQLLFQHLPGYLSSANDFYHHMAEISGTKTDVIELQNDDIRTLVVKVVKHTLDASAGIFGLIINGILVIFLASYFAVEAKKLIPKLLLWVPPDKRERVSSLIGPLGARMGGYVRGQILVSIAVATFLGVGLTLFGVNYSLVLGILAGVLNLVPFVGSMLTGIFAILIALNQSATLALLTLGLFLVEQVVESNFIVPHLLGRQVDLHPLIVLFAVIIGATIGGAVGALAAVPLSSAIVFLAQELYLKPLNEGN